MLIDLIKDKTNIIRVSHFNEINSQLSTPFFSTKTSEQISSWKVNLYEYPISEFIIISNSKCFLKEIKIKIPDYLNTDDLYFKIFISNDYCNWNELEYVLYNGELFKNIESDTNIYVEAKNFSKIKELDFNQSYEYVFTYQDKYTKKDTYFYQDLEFNFLKIRIIKNYPTSADIFYFKDLQILIDETFDDSRIKYYLLSTIAPRFYLQEIFQKETFLPDMIYNFLLMLEKNSKYRDVENQNNFLGNLEINISNLDLIDVEIEDKKSIGKGIISKTFKIY